MSKSANIIILELLGFIYREGGDPKTWYVGVTNDPRKQIFDEQQCITRTMSGFAGRLHLQVKPYRFRRTSWSLDSPKTKRAGGQTLARFMRTENMLSHS